MGAHNSVVGADQGFRAPSWDQESVHDAVHEDSASARIATGQRPRPSFRHPHAYQHVVWLADTGDGQRGWADHRFEGDLETALNGSHVWKVLEAAEKAFGVGEFNAKALLHNLQPRDYSKPLSELRNDFWRVPRLPLLPNGDQDLRIAIWEAVHAGDLTIVDSTGDLRVIRSDIDVNLSSEGLLSRTAVGGHEILPSGGHVAARWRPTVLPSGGQQNCPR